MAEATIPTVTPKEMGSHLRAVRRRKGLSLSEVARGAGLNRRELVNYERGKTAIPESDLWVLAGSIGVDVAELLPPAPPEPPAPTDNLPAVVTHDAATESIGDAVAALRRSTEDTGTSQHLGTLRMLQQLPEGKRVPVKERELAAIAHDLGDDPAAIETHLQQILGVDPPEAARLRAMLLTHTHTHGRRRKARAITAPGVEQPAARYQAPMVPPPPPTAPAPTEHAPVDVFEELARLPEPLPLPEETSVPDFLATPPAPEGAVELVDHATFPTLGSGFGFNLPEPVMAESTAAAATLRSGADAPPIDVAMRQDDDWAWAPSPSPSSNGTDTALPRRPVSDRESPPETTPSSEPALDGTGGWEPPAPVDGATTPTAFWEGTDDWTPDDETAPRSDGVVSAQTIAAAPFAVDAVTEQAADDPASVWSFEPAAVDPWISGGWPEGLADEAPPAATDTDTDADMADIGADPPETADLPEAGPWEHHADPDAVSTGFFVDWGEADDATGDDTAATTLDGPGQWASTGEWDEPLTPAWEMRGDGTIDPATVIDAESAVDPTLDTGAHADAYDAFAADPFATTVDEAAADTAASAEPAEPAEPADTAVWDERTFSFGSDLAATLAATYLTDEPDTLEPDTLEPVADPDAFVPFVADRYSADALPIEAEIVETDTVETDTVETRTAETPFAAPVVDELPRIVWRADAAGNVDSVAVEETASTATPEPEPAEEQFVTAGADWQLGNAVPLVEVQAAGALVMRRADERWALADVATARDFALEVDVDFRSGPGLGVLFRASVDEAGRMSGYSFDIDPIYDGGGYLVRQWQHDRELWNPIARVAATDPTTMYGTLTVRLEVHDETLVASVDGVEVLVVESLEQASNDRDREAATGDRVGVQAWSSTDLVIETLRVAAH